MSPQEAARLVGHSSPQPEAPPAKSHAGAAFNALMEEETKEGVVVMLLDQFDENRRLRSVIDRIRCAAAGTDPQWASSSIQQILREAKP